MRDLRRSLDVSQNAGKNNKIFWVIIRDIPNQGFEI